MHILMNTSTPHGFIHLQEMLGAGSSASPQRRLGASGVPDPADLEVKIMGRWYPLGDIQKTMEDHNFLLDKSTINGHVQ